MGGKARDAGSRPVTGVVRRMRESWLTVLMLFPGVPPVPPVCFASTPSPPPRAAIGPPRPGLRLPFSYIARCEICAEPRLRNGRNDASLPPSPDSGRVRLARPCAPFSPSNPSRINAQIEQSGRELQRSRVNAGPSTQWCDFHLVHFRYEAATRSSHTCVADLPQGSLHSPSALLHRIPYHFNERL